MPRLKLGTLLHWLLLRFREIQPSRFQVLEFVQTFESNFDYCAKELQALLFNDHLAQNGSADSSWS